MTIASELQLSLHELEIEFIPSDQDIKEQEKLKLFANTSSQGAKIFAPSLGPLRNHKSGRLSQQYYDEVNRFLAREIQDLKTGYALNVSVDVFRSGLGEHLGPVGSQCNAIFVRVPAAYLRARDFSDLLGLFPSLDFRCTHIFEQTEMLVFLYERNQRPQPALCLFTSIPPKLSSEAVLQQRKVLNSWRAAGFHPISLNGPQEVADVTAFDLGVEIIPLRDDGKPSISAMLFAIKERGVQRAGLINSDCEIIPYPKISENLAASLRDTLLYAERIDVGDDEPASSGACRGFDAFFFDVGLLDDIEDMQFRLGETWWDYWFPLQLAVNGAKLGKINIPLLIHNRHAARWSDAQWQSNGKICWNHARRWSDEGRLPASLTPLEAATKVDRLTKERLSEFGKICFDTLRRLATPQAFLPASPDLEASLRTLYSYLEDRYDHPKDGSLSTPRAKKKKNIFSRLNRRRLHLKRRLFAKFDAPH